MKATLILPESISAQLRQIAQEPLETAGVLLVNIVENQGDEYRVLAREFWSVPEAEYLLREADALTISSKGYVPALARAEAIGACAIWIHTHPGTGAWPIASSHDQIVDSELAETFRIRTGGDFYGALIISPMDDGFTFSGHMSAAPLFNLITITRVWEVGDRFRLSHEFGAVLPSLSAIFDRNVRAFGQIMQETLGELTIGVVGCGGTGSAVVEQLTRLGVTKFVLLDPDDLSDSNVTRVYGSTSADVGRPKVEIAAANAKAISPNVTCDTFKTSIIEASSAKLLVKCDVIFGCTDDNAGRLVLSRFPTYLLTPIIDCGVLLSSDDRNNLIGIDGRVTVVVPERACLVCRGRIDLAKASGEFLTPSERKRLAAEGYAPGLGQVEPAVVTYTTIVAACAVSELIERFVGYGPEPRPSEILLRMHEREISTNVANSHHNHYCDPKANKLGKGMMMPFLDLLWSE